MPIIVTYRIFFIYFLFIFLYVIELSFIILRKIGKISEMFFEHSSLNPSIQAKGSFEYTTLLEHFFVEVFIRFTDNIS